MFWCAQNKCPPQVVISSVMFLAWVWRQIRASSPHMPHLYLRAGSELGVTFPCPSPALGHHWALHLPFGQSKNHMFQLSVSELFLLFLTQLSPELLLELATSLWKKRTKANCLLFWLMSWSVTNGCVYWEAFIFCIWWCCQMFCQEWLRVSKVLVELMVSNCQIKWNVSEWGSTSKWSFLGIERWDSSWGAPEVLQLWPRKIISNKGFRIFALCSNFCFSV